jgi:hypothetical protein
METTRHANGAVGIAGITVGVEDVEEAPGLYAVVMGVRAAAATVNLPGRGMVVLTLAETCSPSVAQAQALPGTRHEAFLRQYGPGRVHEACAPAPRRAWNGGMATSSIRISRVGRTLAPCEPPGTSGLLNEGDLPRCESLLVRPPAPYSCFMNHRWGMMGQSGNRRPTAREHGGGGPAGPPPLPGAWVVNRDQPLTEPAVRPATM